MSWSKALIVLPAGLALFLLYRFFRQENTRRRMQRSVRTALIASSSVRDDSQAQERISAGDGENDPQDLLFQLERYCIGNVISISFNKSIIGKEIVVNITDLIDLDRGDFRGLYKAGIAAYLRYLASSGTLYIVARCQEDQEETEIRQLLALNNIFDWGLDPVRVVFFSTEKGIESIVRQINPYGFFDTNGETVQEMSKHIRSVVHVHFGTEDPRFKNSLQFLETED